MRRWLNDLIWAAMGGLAVGVLVVIAMIFVSGLFHDWNELRDPELWIGNAVAFVVSFVLVTVVIWADRRNRWRGS